MAEYTGIHKRIINIPSSIVIGEHYQVKIENIYDPSKFWVIVKFKELQIFMRYLKHFYDVFENRNVILRSNLKKNLMCIVYRGDMYHRSVILPVLLPDLNLIRVFMLDSGHIVNVNVKDVFHIFEKHCNVPRFAIRAGLPYICPGGESKSWSQADLKVFCELLGSKRVVAKVCQINTDRKILFTELYVISGAINESVSDKLVDLKVAICNGIYTDNNMCKTKYKCKVKYPHLFPSFEALESGSVPCSLWEHDLVKNSVQLDLLYKDYYEYQNDNCD